jgi:glyoxylase-like metal-dependent hydrolase (beta-lactamase superfamily II)
MFGVGRMVYVHLLVGDEAAMLVDTGCAHNPSQEILPYLAAIGLAPERLTYIVISHSDIDHQGGNARMKEVAPQALLACHNLDRPWVESTDALIEGRYSQFETDHGIGYGTAGKDGIRAGCHSHSLDLTLAGGEQFRLGKGWYVEAIHTPGHTWGHLAIFDPASRTLIAGEATMWNAILDDAWEPAMPPTYCYVDTYLATQDRLRSMSIDLLAPAHWPLQHGPQVAEFIDESRSYCLLVERKLLEFAAARGEFTLRNAVEQLGPTLGRWPAATNQDFSYGMAGNLESLTRRGLLTTGRDPAGHVVWRLP